MSLALKNDSGKNYGDYLAWPEETRLEIIEGQVFAMGPAPSRRHQEILRNLLVALHQQTAGTGCEVYSAPFDVRLPMKNETDGKCTTVVQPDLVVVCDLNKLDDRGCNGAPELIIEIISPSSASHDHIKKRSLYEKHGVGEYWIVHPEHNIVMRRVLLENGKYGEVEVFDETARTSSAVLPEISIEWNTIFKSS